MSPSPSYTNLTNLTNGLINGNNPKGYYNVFRYIFIVRLYFDEYIEQMLSGYVTGSHFNKERKNGHTPLEHNVER